MGEIGFSPHMQTPRVSEGKRTGSTDHYTCFLVSQLWRAAFFPARHKEGSKEENKAVAQSASQLRGERRASSSPGGRLAPIVVVASLKSTGAERQQVAVAPLLTGWMKTGQLFSPPVPQFLHHSLKMSTSGRCSEW